MISRSLPFPRRASFLLVGLLAAVSIPCAVAQEALANHLTKRVVGDYGYWSKYQTPEYGAAQIPYHKLTHINHAGVSFDASGSFVGAPGSEKNSSSPNSTTGRTLRE